MTSEFLKIALVDDHTLFRKGMISLIEVACERYTPVILFEANNGLDMINKIDSNELPDIVVMDMNMEGMNGVEAALWLKNKYPEVNILVVSMINSEESIVRMLRIGVKGYLGKDVEPKELGEALEAIMLKGYYYTDFITGKLIHSLKQQDAVYEKQMLHKLSDNEKEFLRLACSEYTYNEIASMMYLSPKTIDGYRSALFQKLSIKNRVGLALYAIKHGLIVL